MCDGGLEDSALGGRRSVFDFAKIAFGGRGVCALKHIETRRMGWKGQEGAWGGGLCWLSFSKSSVCIALFS